MPTGSVASTSAAMSSLYRSFDGKEAKDFLSHEVIAVAKDNDPDVISALFTLACDGNDKGSVVANFLFSLYTDKRHENSALACQLGRDSLKLVEIVSARNKEKPPEDQWRIPTKLLVMAGFEANNGSQLHSDIVAEIKTQEPRLSLYLEEDTSLFGTNRMVTGAELNVISSELTANTQVQYRDAVGISDADVFAQNVADNLVASLTHADAKHGESSPSMIVIPLLLKDHWVLFGMLKNAAGEKSAVVFSSVQYFEDKHGMQNEYGKYLDALAQACSNDLQSITVLDANLQNHAPNACGIFVVGAIEKMADSQADKAVAALESYVDAFVGSDSAEMALFNIQGRARLFGAVLDRCRAEESAEQSSRGRG